MATAKKKAFIKKVRTEKEANITICVVVYGWKGMKKLARRVIKGHFKVNEDVHWDICSGGYWLGELSDRVFKEWKVKMPADHDWSISEAWSR